MGVDRTETGEAKQVGADDRGDEVRLLGAVGRYDIGEAIGSGGMGVVYRARDTVLDRAVAIKLLAPRSDADRLIAEAKSLARLSHPNVVAVYDAGRVGDQGFLAMELVSGQNLKESLSSGALGRDARIDALIAAGRGLVAAHDAGVIHCDFKPANILVGADGRARVADFGLAVATGAAIDGVARSGLITVDQTDSEVPAGTPAYMAPELLAGGVPTAVSDQYAFAISAWELWVGSRPFDGENLAAMREARSAGAPPRPAEMEVAIYRILARALDPDPDRRFGGLADLIGALAAARRRRRMRKVVAAIALAAVLASSAVGLRLGAGRDAAIAPVPAVLPSAERFAAFEWHIALIADRLGDDNVQVGDLYAQLADAMGVESMSHARIAEQLAEARAIYRTSLGPRHRKSWQAQFWLIYHRLESGTPAAQLLAMTEELVQLRDRDTEWKEWIEGCGMLGRVYFESGDRRGTVAMGRLVWSEAVKHSDWELRARVEAYAAANDIPTDLEEQDAWMEASEP